MIIAIVVILIFFVMIHLAGMEFQKKREEETKRLEAEEKERTRRY